ncbi:hypothetical protein C7C46_08960 [Streptomyces tateyamensis]|uniref:Uncharacterized protein n=1 Tax=Streptomyces tateyamensis TaxID=565073 RepID=A0A2V4NLA8_9ACTN|nr:hypothetical protein [Streptomyces tateyamensis]PYC83452.1 hypothetical protein C7C46_08960 [Streptomyces tateyamensis]
MALLPILTIKASGISPAYGAASAGGDKVSLSAPNTFLHVKNGGASSITVTVTTQNNAYKGLTVPDRIVTVAASGEQMIGPLDAALHADINQQASVAYSAVTTVTIAAFRL